MRALFLSLFLIPFHVLAAPVPLDRIAVVVNDGVILESEVARALEMSRGQIAERGIAAPPEDVLRTQVVERLILNRIQTQRARDAGIRVDDRELNEALSGIAARNDMTLAQFAEAVRKQGLDYLALREQVRDEILISRLRQREVESRVVVSDQDINLFLSSRAGADQTEYRLAHILIALPEGADDKQRAAGRAEAEQLLARIRAGEDFAELAIAHSDGQQALQGGDLDWRKRGDLPEVFARELARLEPGGVSEVLATNSGFHIIKLTDQRSGETRQTVEETHARHILLQPNALRDAEQTAALARELHARLRDGADFAALAREHSDDPGSKNAGGDLGWQPPGTFVPEFQAALDALQPGQISAPFQTSFGWHIAKLIERRTRDTTDEMKRMRARQTIHNRKAAEEYEQWLRRLREEAYVEYRLRGSSTDGDAAS